MRVFTVLFLLLITAACMEDTVRIEQGIYFWENNTPELTADNRTALTSLKVEKFYLKVFEVDRLDGVNQPIAKSLLKLTSTDVKNRELVPCVYILDKVFIQSSKEELDELAENVVHLTTKYLSEKLVEGMSVDGSEIQIDCDWSEKSQGNYFYFLRKVKKLSNWKVSCTLRLYPYKFYERMGVPPCDRAMLMCYNLLNPLKNPRKNTILDVDEMSKYLDTDVKYPISLDVALPVYSWMQCYDRDRFKGVIHGPTEEYANLMKHDEGLWYHMTSDTVASNIYLRKGDRIKIERVSQEDLSKAIRLIKSSGVLKGEAVFSYFHLNSQELKFYGYEKLIDHTTSLSD